MIHRCPKDAEHPFTNVPNALAEDSSLSYEARGMVAYLMSVPEGYPIKADLLAEAAPNTGREKVRGVMKELFERGLLERAVSHDAKGRITVTTRLASWLRPAPSNIPQAKALGLEEWAAARPKTWGDSSAHVYFVVSASGLYKIGITRRPVNARIRRLRAPDDSVGRVRLIATKYFEHAETVEEWLHYSVAEKRVTGEWFRLSADEAETIGGFLQ